MKQNFQHIVLTLSFFDYLLNPKSQCTTNYCHLITEKLIRSVDDNQ